MMIKTEQNELVVTARNASDSSDSDKLILTKFDIFYKCRLSILHT